MDKRKKAALILIVILLAAAVVALLNRCTSCLIKIEAIEAAVIDIRQLEPLEDAALNFQTPEEYEVELAERFEENFSDEEDVDGLLFYRALDLIESDVDLKTAYFNLLTSNVVGYYDPETDEMTLILDAEQGDGDELRPWDSLTYAHEFAHALQDQHYDLEAISDQADESDNYDFQLAIDALIEGDASKVTFDYFDKMAQDIDPRALEEMALQAEIEISSRPAAESIPAIIEESFMFPYEAGRKFVNYIVKELGWPGVDRAFQENPPRSSEHILHPWRYLDGDLPLEVSLPDVSAVIGGDWRLVYDNAAGEFYLRQHLETQLPSPLVTHGWGGDRLRLFTDEANDGLLWIWQLTWDSPRDAERFNHRYGVFLNRRYATLDDDGPCWTADETHCFRPISETETRITYAADPTVALALLNLGH